MEVKGLHQWLCRILQSLAPAGDIITVAKQKKQVHVHVYKYIYVHVLKLSGRDVSTSSHKLAIYIHL